MASFTWDQNSNDRCPVALLIGNDNPSLLEPLEVRRSQDGGPYAVRTMLGWVINGPLGHAESTHTHKANLIRSDVALDEQFREFCSQEFSDSLVSTAKQISQEDRKALQIMEESAQLKGGHYEIALPMRPSYKSLPDNRSLIEHRLQLLKRRLLKDPELHAKYSSFMTDLLDREYAEQVPEKPSEQPLTWYLPHQPVFNPRKPTKTRIVFDCSAKCKDISLNDALLQGPDLTNTLVGVLLRFRQEPVAFMADVEAMFHQVRVKPEQCDLLRFLWWPGGNLAEKPQVYRMKVHLFGTVFIAISV